MRLASAASEWPLIYLVRRLFVSSSVPPPLPRIDRRQAEFVLQEIDVASVYQRGGRPESSLRLGVEQQNGTEDFTQRRVYVTVFAANVLRCTDSRREPGRPLLSSLEPPGPKLVSLVGPKVKLL